MSSMIRAHLAFPGNGRPVPGASGFRDRVPGIAPHGWVWDPRAPSHGPRGGVPGINGFRYRAPGIAPNGWVWAPVPRFHGSRGGPDPPVPRIHGSRGPVCRGRGLPLTRGPEPPPQDRHQNDSRWLAREPINIVAPGAGGLTDGASVLSIPAEEATPYAETTALL